MSEENQKPQRRVMPQSELDLVLMTTDSVWGKTDVPLGLQNKLKAYMQVMDKDGKLIYDEKGSPVVSEDNLWGLLGFFTRDMRLANLSVWNGELKYCQYFLDLAGDFLQSEMIEPFLICLQRAATVLELSQSKGGFLRRRMNTFTQESTALDSEPPKKSLFGSQKKDKVRA